MRIPNCLFFDKERWKSTIVQNETQYNKKWSYGKMICITIQCGQSWRNNPKPICKFLLNGSLFLKAMVIHSHCPYYYFSPIAQLIVLKYYKLWSQNLRLKSIVNHRMTLALIGARAYGGQFGWTNNLELPHTKVDHGIGGYL
jgi:hypothetical protein